jgi:hypothetical protein
VPGTGSQLVLATSQTTTSGTSKDFTGIPSWVKRITVMFNGVSTSGVSVIQIQIGSGSIDTTSTYTGAVGSRGGEFFYTTGFQLNRGATASVVGASLATLCTSGSNVWAISGTWSSSATDGPTMFAGNKTLSGSLDRIRITTVNGTDTFDAGTINILYE